MEQEFEKFIEIVGNYLVVGLIIALIVFLVIRPLLNWVSKRRDENGELVNLGTMVAVIVLSLLFAVQSPNFIADMLGHSFITVLIDMLFYAAVTWLAVVALEDVWDTVSVFFDSTKREDKQE